LYLHPNIFTGEDMKNDEIIKMARRAGFSVDVSNDPNNPPYWWSAGHNDRFEAFAKLVAQHEREACAVVCDDLWEDDGTAYDCAEAIRTLGQA
jgi:hypothetical protein